MHMGPLPLSASKLHVYSLDLVARKLFFNVQIKANQSKDNADWPAKVVGGLHGERVHHVLQDKPRAAHRVGVHFVVSGAHGIHIVDSLVKDLSTVQLRSLRVTLR